MMRGGAWTAVIGEAAQSGQVSDAVRAPSRVDREAARALVRARSIIAYLRSTVSTWPPWPVAEALQHLDNGLPDSHRRADGEAPLEAPGAGGPRVPACARRVAGRVEE